MFNGIKRVKINFLKLFSIRYFVTATREVIQNTGTWRGGVAIINMTMWFMCFLKWFVGRMYKSLEL